MERGIKRKIFLSQCAKFIQNFLENNTEALAISKKTQVPLG